MKADQFYFRLEKWGNLPLDSLPQASEHFQGTSMEH